MPANNQKHSSTGQKPKSGPKKAPKKTTTQPKTVNTGQTQQSTSDHSNQTASAQILRESLRASPEPITEKYQAREASTRKPYYTIS
ncbi:hypothetical protein BTUL_0145g00160 [Botrytis tulipae]|uniref:Uncharacterized protein n=1 Tax=Botrytis tulipae TaxID=87230 RepID=A0A4Z1EFQ2_9HELO|nr:hypothetical protein BTUL_0145g00160 [Botrytis tulipae]